MAGGLPLYNERQVQVSNQSPGYQQVQYSPEAFGAGVGDALQETGQQVKKFAALQTEIKDQQDTAQALDISTQMDDALRPALYDPTTGAFAKNGGQALGIGASMDETLGKIRKEKLDGITDPHVRRAVEKMWTAKEQSVKNQVAGHEMSQVGVYRADVQRGVVLGAMQDAYNGFNDPKIINEAISKTRMAIAANAAGMSAESVKAAEADAVSGIHMAVINRLATEDPQKALEYFEAHKKDVSGSDNVKVQQFIGPALDQRWTKNWMAEHTGSSQSSVNLYKAVIGAESSGNTMAESSKGAAGLMQLIPSTARGVAKELGMAVFDGMTDEQVKRELKTNAGLNVKLGTSYLQSMLKQYGGDVEVALVAYNAGPGGADDFLQHNVGRRPGQRDYNVPGRGAIKRETEPYVSKILRNWDGGTGRIAAPVKFNGDAVAFLQQRNLTHGPEAITNMQPALQNGLAAMISAAPPEIAAGLSIMSGYRSNDRQSQLFTRAVAKYGSTAAARKWVAPPAGVAGSKGSRHSHGQAADLNWNGQRLDKAPANVQKWLHDNAAQFGLAFPLGNEAWHVEVAGARDGQNSGGIMGTGGTGYVPSTSASPYADTSRPALEAWMAESQSIADPSRRSMVQQQIQLLATQQNAQAKLDEENAKKAAWQTVLQGKVDDIRPELLAKLEPGYVNTLMEYEKKRAQPEGIINDYKTWSQVSTMTPQQLRDADIYGQFRNSLDDSHFDQALALQRAAQAEARGDKAASQLLANTRTDESIRSGAMSALGFKMSSTSGAEQINQFSLRFDQQVLAQQEAKGKKLNSDELQDIADKLVIEDKTSGMFSWLGGSKNQGYGFQTEDPTKFVAASDWTEVQADDRATLVSTYRERFGTDPDRERALALYNSAMQVYNGAASPLRVAPDDDIARLTEQYTAATGAAPPKQKLEELYAKWLLGFLGVSGRVSRGSVITP